MPSSRRICALQGVSTLASCGFLGGCLLPEPLEVSAEGSKRAEGLHIFRREMEGLYLKLHLPVVMSAPHISFGFLIMSSDSQMFD